MSLLCIHFGLHGQCGSNMVDGFFTHPMAAVATNGANQQRQRKQRATVTVAHQLDVLRTSSESSAVRNALADLAMRLIDPEDRSEFENFDGPTVIVDNLSRMIEEQATMDFAWEKSTSHGVEWEMFEVHESLLFTVVTVCHACIEESMAQQCLEMGAARLLWELYVTLPKPLDRELQPLALSGLRNLSHVKPTPGALPSELIQESWRLATEAPSIETQTLAIELLTNTASHDASFVSPTRERITLLLDQFFQLEDLEDASYRRVTVVDLLCNLCVDPALCLLIMYELDDRKPRRYRHHSGAVYFLDLTEAQRDPALRQSMEALAHNLSWSDPAGKRSIQKLGLSSYMARFALEPAIN